jgi:hypothetical protein
MGKVSDCCEASLDDGGGYQLDICPECGEHCEYIDEDECEECGGHGELPLGHPSDPDCDYYPCPECDKRDPDTRDR